MKKEHRQHERIPAQMEPVVMVTEPPPSFWVVISNSILDISEGGIGFTYSGWEEWPDGTLNLSIVVDEMSVDGIPAKVVSDAPFDKGVVSTRRCGMEFGDLTETQRDIVRKIIEWHRGE